MPPGPERDMLLKARCQAGLPLALWLTRPPRFSGGGGHVARRINKARLTMRNSSRSGSDEIASLPKRLVNRRAALTRK